MLTAIGITSYVAFVGAYRDLEESRDRAYEELRFADFQVQVVGAPRSVMRELEDVDGVAAVEGRIVADTGMDVDADTQGTVRVVGIPVDKELDVDALLVQDGSYLEPREADAGLVNAKFATDADRGPGDTLRVRTDGAERDIRIAGVVASPEYMFPVRSKAEVPIPKEFAVVYMDEHEAQRLLGLPEGYNDFVFRVAAGADVDRVIDRVEDVLGRYGIKATIERADQPSNFGLNEEISQNRTLSSLAPALILSISALSLYIALSRLVRSQRGEIGLAKALGYGNGAIVFHYLLFSLFIAVAGSVLGFALGFALAGLITNEYTTLLGIPYLAHRVHADVVAGAVLLSSAACLLAGIAPALSSARMRPAEAMHSDPNLALTGGHVPLLERAFGWAMPRNFTFRIPFRNVFRARRRSLSTIVGIAFAGVLTVATVSMFDSMDDLLDRALNVSERWDVSGFFAAPFGPEVVRDVEDWGGVADVQPALVVPVELSAHGEKHEGPITAMDPDADFHGFDVAEGNEVSRALRRGGLVLPAALAGKLEVALGESVKVESPYTENDMELEVRCISEEAWGAPFFTSAAIGQELLGTARPAYNALYIDLARGADAQDVKERVYELPGAAQVTVKQSFVDTVNSMMGMTYLFFGVFLAFGFSMAFVVIYNTFTANVLERTRELASMRTIGESRSRLAVMITIENLLLATVGIPLGVWLGVQAAGGILSGLSTEAYTMRAILRPESLAAVIVMLLGVLLVSQMPPIRRVFRLDLAEATKMRE